MAISDMHHAAIAVKGAMALALILPIAALMAPYLAAKFLNPGPPFVTDYS